MKHLVLVVVLGLLGCGLATEGVRYPESCTYYERSYIGWTATNTAASGLAGASGTIAALVGGLVDDPTDVTIGMGVTGAVMGVLATVASLLANEYAERFTANCGGEGP